jgi:FkbM family methyltransferase
MKPPFGVGKEKWFTDNGHGKPTGTIHVGINDGTELGWYLQEGQVPILAFEPIPEVFGQTVRDFNEEITSGKIWIYNCALSNNEGWTPINIPIRKADGIPVTPGASFLEELNLDEEYRSIIGPYCSIYRFDYLIYNSKSLIDPSPFDMSRYDLLVVDVQGMELEVLEGFGDFLQCLKYLVIECSQEPMYKGEASAIEVCDFLDKRGFDRMTPILSHNDILFLRRPW